jgi:hypothetical protein
VKEETEWLKEEVYAVIDRAASIIDRAAVLRLDEEVPEEEKKREEPKEAETGGAEKARATRGYTRFTLAAKQFALKARESFMKSGAKAPIAKTVDYLKKIGGNFAGVYATLRYSHFDAFEKNVKFEARKKETRGRPPLLTADEVTDFAVLMHGILLRGVSVTVPLNWGGRGLRSHALCQSLLLMETGKEMSGTAMKMLLHRNLQSDRPCGPSSSLGLHYKRPLVGKVRQADPEAIRARNALLRAPPCVFVLFPHPRTRIAAAVFTTQARQALTAR